MKSVKVLSVVLFVAVVISACKSTKTTSSQANASQTTSSQTTTSQTTSSQTGDGLSFEQAIVVNSIAEEYEWIKKNYPGARVQMQALTQHNGKPHDVLTFITADGRKLKGHFDISKFFGKGF